MKRKMKAFLMALAAVVAAAAELSAQPVVSQKLLNCQGLGADGSHYETTISITSRLLPQGLQTSYELANVKTPTANQPQAVTYAAYGQPFAFASGGTLLGSDARVVLGEWGDDQVMYGTLHAVDFAPPAGVPVACRRNEDDQGRVAFAPFPLDDAKSLAGLLTALVVAHEGIPINADTGISEDFHLDVDAGDETPCVLSSPGVLTCEASYLQGRWNGEVLARFAVQGQQVTGLIDTAFDGSF